jgi:hypothetical protein
MTIDLKWQVPKSNQLWVKWKSVQHLGDGTIKLLKPILYGPVLSDCLPIDEAGELVLDLTKHFIVLIPQPYEVKLSWTTKLTQTTAEASFSEMLLSDNTLGLLKLLKNKDQLLIDCTDHTTEKVTGGHFKLTFGAMLYDSNGSPYNLIP